MLTDSDIFDIMLWTPSGGGCVADTGCRLYDGALGDYEIWAFRARARGPARYGLFLRRGSMLHSMDKAFAQRGPCAEWPFDESFISEHASFMSKQAICQYIRVH